MTSCTSPYPSTFHFCFSFWRKTLWLTGFTSRCWSWCCWNVTSHWISLHGRRGSYRETGKIWRWKVSERAPDIHFKDPQGYITLIFKLFSSRFAIHSTLGVNKMQLDSGRWWLYSFSSNQLVPENTIPWWSLLSQCTFQFSSISSSSREKGQE